ncbi:MAG: histidine kinase [Puniceicoccaceae bacterium 5H]|nr:MAG: histidine kinase [Puniceicoccaceae bacterium 5H]
MGTLRAARASGDEMMVGLPYVRTYSLNEIGASRGAHLTFDYLGRIAVVSGSNYTVLNDNTWLPLMDQSTSVPHLLDFVWAEGNRSYYGSLADWGRAKLQPDGSIQCRSLRPATFPNWVRANNFKQIVVLQGGVLFAGYNGVVYEDEASGERQFIEIPELTRVFELGSTVYASSLGRGLLRLDLDQGTTEIVDSAMTVDKVAQLGDHDILFTTMGNRLVRFDGQAFTNWEEPFGVRVKSSVSCLTALPGGGIAIAVDGEGVFVLSRDGSLLCTLTTADYQRVFDLASNEEGVLWLTTEMAVHKVLYHTGISVVDQRSGVIVEWPQVVEWQGMTVTASHGRLYDLIYEPDLLSYQFEQVSDVPISGAWGLDEANGRLLVCNSNGVYARTSSGFETVLPNIDAARLVMTDNDLCYVIGLREIALLKWDGTQWVECAPRIAGVGFPWIVHLMGRSAWIELGTNVAARLSYQEGKLKCRVFDQFDWDGGAWVNIGNIGDIVVLCGPDGERRYFDNVREQFIEAPELEAVLAKAPHSIKRVAEDASGRWWAAHENGILVYDGDGEGQWQSPFAGRFRDRYPVLHLVGQGDMWASTESAFYHLDQELPVISPVEYAPQLVSVTDGRTGEALYTAGLQKDRWQHVSHERNHLIFRFFAGGYPSLQSLSYRFTIRRGGTEWTMLSTDSLLALPNLWEGDYEITSQILSGGNPVGQPAVVAFHVSPPWFRQPLMYPLYAVLVLLAVVLFRAYIVRQANRKHAMLERLVRERTEELRATMDRLTEEARTSATLAERNRLAEEMHDSVQQGLSGLMLQLDATLKLGHLDSEVRSRLLMARKMVAFTREEVQQALWGLESPFLENADLAGALQTMAQLVTCGKPAVEVCTVGEARSLDSSTQHHLLRIAQEAITNAMRHSETESVRVTLEYGAGSVILEVRDFGSGFAPDDGLCDEPGHFGLRGMRTRAARIDGHLEISSERGQGTVIRVELPLPRPETRHTHPTDDHAQDQNPACR